MFESVAPISIPLPDVADNSKRAFPISPRTLKMTAAATISFIGAYGVLSESRYISTSNAIMSAYVIDVRTPIEGTVSDLPLVAGQLITKGQLLGRIDNSLSDHQHLDNLRLAEETAASQVNALGAERTALESLRRALLLRADHHASITSERLEHQISDASHTLSARQIAFQQADTELARGRELHNAGIIANAVFEQLESNQRVLAEEASAQRATVGSLKTQATAMRHGMLSEPGTNNDVAYSTQRADEIAIKLAENSRALIEEQMQAHQAHITVEREANRDAQLTTSELRAPSSGLLWKINAMNGEHTVSGSQVLSMVDCNRQFLLAEIPQDRLSSVFLHGQAHIRFAGERMERTGTVLSASGDPQRDMDHKLAATPVGDPTQELATVLISVDAAPETSDARSGCLVGRTARVRIPSTGDNLLSHWIADHL